MRFIVQFTDNEEFAHKRQEHMQDHLAFLGQNKETVLSAGPLFDLDSGDGAGGLWIVEAESEAVVQSLVEEDPFYPTGLRQDIKILQWKVVFESGEALL